MDLFSPLLGYFGPKLGEGIKIGSRQQRKTFTPGRCRCWKLTCPEMEKWLLGLCPPTHSAYALIRSLTSKPRLAKHTFSFNFSPSPSPSPNPSPSRWFHPACRNLCPTLWKMFTMTTPSSATDHASRSLPLSLSLSIFQIGFYLNLNCINLILFWLMVGSDLVICGFVGFWIDLISEVWIFDRNWILNPVKLRLLDF